LKKDLINFIENENIYFYSILLPHFDYLKIIINIEYELIEFHNEFFIKTTYGKY